MCSDSPKISVIVPVYNVEDFLRKCLESIQQQTFKDFEVLIVDDASPDNSLAIANEFAESDSRFKVIQIEHAGLAGARNAGIENAKGEYLSFIDSDDYVSPVFLEKLYNACIENHADIAICNFAYYYLNENKIKARVRRLKDGVISSEKAINLILRDSYIQSYAWNKLYKRSLYVENDIRYPSMCFEDLATSVKLFFYTDRIAGIDDTLYFYTQRNGSIMNKNKLTPEKINNLMCSISIVGSFLTNNGIFNKFKKSFYCLTRKFQAGSRWFIYLGCLDNRNFKGLLKSFRMIDKNFKHIKQGQESSDLPYTL